jgi:uncharacterized protein with PQ loop repeat
MYKTKKVGVTFLFLVILPIIVLVSLSYFVNHKFLEIEINSLVTINQALLYLSVFGCIINIYLNYKSEFPRRIWYVVSTALGLAILILLYLGYIFSHSGLF